LLPTDEDLICRLRRVEGQVRGLQRMIEEGRSCREVLVQLTALREALNQVGVAMIVRHMEGCFQDEATGGPSPADRPRRLKEAVQMFLKFS